MKFKFNLILLFLILFQVNLIYSCDDPENYCPNDPTNPSFDPNTADYSQIDYSNSQAFSAEFWNNIPVDQIYKIPPKDFDPTKFKDFPEKLKGASSEQILPNIDKFENLKDLDSNKVSALLSENYGISVNIEAGINVKFNSMTGELSGNFGSYDTRQYPKEKFNLVVEGNTMKIIPINEKTGTLDSKNEVTISGAQRVSRNDDGSLFIAVSNNGNTLITGNQKGTITLQNGKTLEFESKNSMSSFSIESNGDFVGSDAIVRIKKEDILTTEINGNFQKNSEGIILYPGDGKHSSFEDFEAKIKISSTGVNSLFIGQRGVKEPESNFVIYGKDYISAKGQFGIEQKNLKVFSKDKGSTFSLNEKKEMSAKGVLELETKDYKYEGLTKSTLLNTRVENGKDVVKITGDDEGKIAKLAKKVSVITTYAGQKVYTTSEKELLTEIFNTKGKISLKLDSNSDKILKGVANSKDNFIYIKNDLIVELGEDAKSKLTISKDLGLVYEQNGKKSESFSYKKVLDVVGEKYVDLNQRLTELNSAIKLGSGDIKGMKNEKEYIEFLFLGKSLETKTGTDAIKELKSFIDKHPNSEMSGVVNVELAKQYINSKDIVSAHEILLKTKNDPKTFQDSSMLLATIYIQRGEVNYAFKELDEVLAKNPKNIGALDIKQKLSFAILDKINQKYGEEQSALIQKSLDKVGANDNLASKLNLNMDTILGRAVAASDMGLGQTIAIYSGQLDYLSTIRDEELKKASEIQIGISTMKVLMKNKGLTLEQVAAISDPTTFSKVMDINYDGGLMMLRSCFRWFRG